jgi:hypothetical protein
MRINTVTRRVALGEVVPGRVDTVGLHAALRSDFPSGDTILAGNHKDPIDHCLISLMGLL